MSVCTVRDAFVTGLILAVGAVAVAQDDGQQRTPFYGSSGSLLISRLARPGVQKEIGLDEPASTALLNALKQIDPSNPAFRTNEERRQTTAMLEETTQKIEAGIQKSLSEEQLRRFQQLEMQYLGGRALLTPEAAQEWMLTTEQQERLKSIRNGFTGASGPGDEDASVRMERYKNDLLAVLTSEQIKQWKEKAGTPFKPPKSYSGPSWRLILLPEVQKELGLSEEGAETLRQSLTAIQREGTAERFRAIGVGRDPDNAMRQSEQIIDTVRTSLTVPQWNRLQELLLQERGVMSISNPEVATALGLSREQQERVRSTITGSRRELGEARSAPPTANERRTQQQKEQADLLDILTPDQQKQWEAMQGTKVDVLSLIRSSAPPASR